VEDYCKDLGFNLILCNADDDPHKEEEYIDMLTDKQIDGLIINTTGHNEEMVISLNERLPVVLIDRKISKVSVDMVAVNNVNGALAAVRHLIHLGYRDIALFTMPYSEISPRAERVEGYKQALAESGIPFRPEFVVEAQPTEAALQKKLEVLLSSNRPPGAIFGTNNLMSMTIVRTLKKMGIGIPEEIALVSFDDWEWAELIEPPITVVAQPTYEIGKKAAKLLISHIKSMETKQRPYKPSMVILEPKLIKRKSCGEHAD
jgi:DNA-binding LacI/PurR family transcriptional regulator